jgi:translation initiation factor 2B subunit (eIF-2B alpha/beta/delta family)
MDRVLSRRIDGIARDDQSGAAELALEAVNAFEAWRKSQKTLTSRQLLEVARALSRAHSEMAPLQRLAAEIAAASKARNPTADLATRLATFAKTAATASAEIAALFAALVPRRKIHVATYSYSSTAVGAILRAKRRISLVYVSEGRPGNEGRTTAGRLARAGLRVVIVPDVVLLSQLPPVSHVVFGADAILPTGFFNKTGSSFLLRAGLARGANVWVLADTLKFLPHPPAFHPSLGECNPNWIFWDRPPARVTLRDQIHELVPYDPGMRLLTERGLMTVAAVRKQLHYLQRNTPRLVV